jgi:hypothetical protein
MSFQIDRVWIFVAQEPGGDEGVIAENRGGTWFPFVAADEKRLEQLKERARALPLTPGTTLKLIRFDARTEVETLS